jgi:hypothetical protein
VTLAAGGGAGGVPRHNPGTDPAGNIPGNLEDNHRALISVLVLVAGAFVASGIAGHSHQAATVVVLVLVAVTFLLTLNVGLWAPGSETSRAVESYPWLPSERT